MLCTPGPTMRPRKASRAEFLGIDLQPEHVVFVPHAFRIDNHAAGSDFRSEVAAQGFDVFRRGLNSHHQFRAAIERLARIDADICAAIEDDVAVADAAFAGAVDLPVLLGKIVEYGVGLPSGIQYVPTGVGLPPPCLVPAPAVAVDCKSARGFQLLAQEPVGWQWTAKGCIPWCDRTRDCGPTGDVCTRNRQQWLRRWPG